MKPEDKIEIKIFENSTNRDLVHALYLYAKNIDFRLRTDTREIIYWLDNYNTKYEDNFHVIGFYYNKILVGFSQYVFFKKEKVLFVDYIVIDKEYRSKNLFFEAKELLVEDARKRFNIEHILFEVAYTKNTDKKNSLVRLLQINKFQILKNDYVQPLLNNTDAEFVLMNQSFVDSKLESSYLEMIYENHYLRWYTPFLNETELNDYKKLLETLY